MGSINEDQNKILNQLAQIEVELKKQRIDLDTLKTKLEHQKINKDDDQAQSVKPANEMLDDFFKGSTVLTIIAVIFVLIMAFLEKTSN